MVDTTSEELMAYPKAAISKLFHASYKDGNPDMSSDFDIPYAFECAFADPAQMQKIPQLNTLPASSLITGKLVRFLGMVQDTSYSHEIYVGATRKNTWTCHRYETANVDLDMNSPDVILDERTGVYVTSIPGSAKWLQANSVESLSLEDFPAILRGDKDRVISHGQQEIGVVVKCYSGIESPIKVCDLVEIIGILEMPEESEEDEHIDVVIHAVILKRKQLHEIVLSNREQLSPCTPYPGQELMEAELTRGKDLSIQHLTNILEGDDLAAQSILLNLTSSLAHRNPISLGSLPMNIYSVPTATTRKLVAFLQSVLPAVAIEKLSIESLNKQRLFPRSDGEKLSAGRGQFVARTALIIDESHMQEGKLLDTGVRNLRFLSRIAAAQKLSFEFPYHEFDIDTDISFLVLGDSKSVLPVHPVPSPPLNLVSSLGKVTIAFPHVKGETSAQQSPLSPEETQIIQTYLAQLSTLAPIAINESIAEEMQSSFVKARKDTPAAESQAVDETWFGTRIVVAKSIARINAHEKMDREDWKESLRVCAQWDGRRKVMSGV